MTRIESISINLSKVTEEHITIDKNGNRWLNITAIVADVPNEWGKNIQVTLPTKTKEEPKTYIGNGKTIFPKQQ
jgi:hypothetical protein